MQTLFYILKSKVNKQGLAPLNLRITVGPGDVSEISTGKKVDPKLWDVNKKRVSGRSAAADIVNKYIIHAENKINNIETDLQIKEIQYNSQIIKNTFTGEGRIRYTLVGVTDSHNSDFKHKAEMNLPGYTKGTLDKYITFKKKVIRFMEEKYKRSDLFVTELNYDFIESFFDWMLINGRDDKGTNFNAGLDRETACGIIAKLKKVASIAFKKESIALNPFNDFKCSFSKESKIPLTMEEVKLIMEKTLTTKRLDKVRDRVIVGCFTGLSNSDIESATHDMLVTDMQGNKWLDKGRTKTGELCLIPLWEPVLKIIDKYKDDESLKKRNALFPSISLQKANEYIHEIGEICGINKKMTTHIFRHTFANFYINSGGTLGVLARILGHSNTRSTSTYAKYDKSSIKRESDLVMNEIFKEENSDFIKIAK